MFEYFSFINYEFLVFNIKGTTRGYKDIMFGNQSLRTVMSNKLFYKKKNETSSILELGNVSLTNGKFFFTITEDFVNFDK